MIKLICIGNLKEIYLKEAVKEYEKRLSKYTKLEIIELKDLSYDDESKVLYEEGQSILKHIDSKDYVITMEIEGENLSSEEFASKLDSIQINNSNIVFVIGGSLGLSNEVKERSNYKLSFSKMTFPHQLFRIILLEQIYRAFKINNNESYHK
ncbi:MAG: 23S rRNA (pseudouridine(1915)-N(3))-methyltransferase RlmH [Bacilli bacterium]|nr:23S rRNA (pseudouridine(1915)-N(3))-methyltransferase RlmH [Bacilli bacterium]MBQ6538702.1 23S rRNA (pseudouridine(1915)-N(3))-methyltransferase RlmH [Bacilli bacterium]